MVHHRGSGIVCGCFLFMYVVLALAGQETELRFKVVRTVIINIPSHYSTSSNQALPLKKSITPPHPTAATAAGQVVKHVSIREAV